MSESVRYWHSPTAAAQNLWSWIVLLWLRRTFSFRSVSAGLSLLGCSCFVVASRRGALTDQLRMHASGGVIWGWGTVVRWIVALTVELS